MKVLTGISRLLVGLLFIFSGFIKANDPIGFSYKLTEYYSVFGTGFLQHYEVVQAILICVAEIVLGVCVLIGTRMRITSWLLLLMILFFTFLTGFTAIGNWFFENPDSSTTQWWANLLGFVPREIYYMKDCGCFGDAIKLTPWQSFFKDLLLLLLILIIFLRRNKIRPYFARIMQTNLILFFTAASAFFSVYCWMYMPVINYLKWQEGNDILQLTTEIPDEREYRFVYRDKQSGELGTYTADNLPNDPDRFEYVDRKDSIIKAGKPAEIHDFSIRNAQDEDITREVLEEETFKLFIVAYDLSTTRVKSIRKFRDHVKAWQDKGYKVYAFTNSDRDEFEKFRHEHQLAFPFYQMDRTALKSVIRSNPGYILLYKGTVVARWSARNSPDIKDLEKAVNKYTKKNGL